MSSVQSRREEKGEALVKRIPIRRAAVGRTLLPALLLADVVVDFTAGYLALRPAAPLGRETESP